MANNLEIYYEIPTLDQLSEWLRNNPECTAIIIDTLKRFCPSEKTHGTQYEQEYRAMGELQKWTMQNKVAVLVVHHCRKQSGEKDILDEINGSTGLAAAADAIWILKRSRNQDDATLTITGRDVSQQTFALRFDNEKCRFDFLGDAEVLQISEQRREILDLLRSYDGEPMTPKQIASELGRTQANIRRLLTTMKGTGQVKRISRGRYIPGNYDHNQPQSRE